MPQFYVNFVNLHMLGISSLFKMWVQGRGVANLLHSGGLLIGCWEPQFHTGPRHRFFRGSRLQRMEELIFWGILMAQISNFKPKIKESNSLE